MGLLRSVRSKLGKTIRPRREFYINTADDLMESIYWIERPPQRLLVPASLLRMQGAYVYGPNHPFVDALSNGKEALRDFYRRCQPTTICGLYKLDGKERRGADLPPWELPWYGRTNRSPPPGELRLGAEHGVSFYGPVTEAKLSLEHRRLDKLHNAIQRNGYDCNAYGDIEGYVLNNGRQAVFFVRGGKHRAAVLSALGHERIPVAFRSSFPRMVHAVDAERWPLVRSGAIDITLAKDIFNVYMLGRSN